MTRSRSAAWLFVALVAGGCNDKLAPWTAASTPTGPQEAVLERRTLAPHEAAARCALDALDGAPAPAATGAARGDSLTVEGWITSQSGTDPGSFLLVLDGPTDFAANIQTTVARPDVATVLAKPDLASAGFKASVRLDVAPGTYTLAATLTAGGRIQGCTMPLRIEVR